MQTIILFQMFHWHYFVEIGFQVDNEVLFPVNFCVKKDKFYWPWKATKGTNIRGVNTFARHCRFLFKKIMCLKNNITSCHDARCLSWPRHQLLPLSARSKFSRETCSSVIRPPPHYSIIFCLCVSPVRFHQEVHPPDFFFPWVLHIGFDTQ